MNTQEQARRILDAATALQGVYGATVFVGVNDDLARDIHRRASRCGRLLGGNRDCEAFTSIRAKLGDTEINIYGPSECGTIGERHAADQDAATQALRDIADGKPAPEQPDPGEAIRASRAAFVPSLAARANHVPHPAIPVDDLGGEA